MRILLALTVIAAAAGLAVVTWRSHLEQASAVVETKCANASQDEVTALRLALASAKSESAAYRAELDRFVSRIEPSDASNVREPDEAAANSTAASARFNELAARYHDRLSRAAVGDEAAADEAYAAVIELLRGGEAAFPALRDAYLSASDGRVKAVMLRAFLVSHGQQAQDFIASQLESETDPDLRDALVAKAERMSTPGTAPIFRNALLRAFASDADGGTRAAAVRGLRFLSEDPEVDGALLAAAKDSNDEVRLAAIESLAALPGRRKALAELLRGEANERIRAIGECRILLAEPAAQP